jgi:RNA polymerase sigma factor (sigma-70 family)
VLEGQRRLHHFKAGLRALSPRRREVFILYRIEGYSFAQIAQKLGITISMAEKHAARAMLCLADWMTQEGHPATREKHPDNGRTQ